jgi:protoheme ferro-lyase
MRRHVILLTYGEPPTPEFFAQLRYSWRILLGLTRSVAPIPVPLLPLIALSRARFRWKLWTDERYSSPLEPITREQAAGLGVALAARAPEVEWRVHVAYEFRDPLLTTMLDSLPAGEPVDIVPMYVADSAFTHEISRATIAAWSRKRSATPAPGATPVPGVDSVRVLPPIAEEKFAAISARHIEREIAARRIGGPQWALMLAAHGTLLEPPRPIETGRAATESVCTGIASRLASRFGKIQNGWLNHVYGGRWTEPPADQALRQIAEAGFRRVVYYPYGFSADNAESELEGRLALRTQPGLEAVHLPCLNASREFLEALAAHVIECGVRDQVRIEEPETELSAAPR